MDFSDTLLLWYDSHRRDLPWRRTCDPYRIWISEIILQQTRVEQGWDYYLRFVERFPTVEALAQAHEDEVLRLWQGLGYYSRARNLHAAAKTVAKRGSFPTAYEDVRALKGVGDYTAAAVCSIAYNQPVAVLDGNVFRVLARYFHIDVPINSTQGKHYFAKLAQELLPARQAGRYNQAIMDFGALQCVPARPDCEQCPLKDSCVSFEKGEVSNYPVKEHRMTVKERYLVYCFLHQNGKVLMHRRTGRDIWRGLYEPLLLEFPKKPQDADIFSHAVLQSIDSGMTLCERVGVMKHKLTHRTLLLRAFEAQVGKNAVIPEGCFWADAAQIESLPLPRAVEVLFEQMADQLF